MIILTEFTREKNFEAQETILKTNNLSNEDFKFFRFFSFFNTNDVE